MNVFRQKHELKTWLLGSVLAMNTALVGCGSDSTANQGEANNGESVHAAQMSAEKGTLVLAITDAEEDFVSYTIGINSILMTRENGDRIEILPEATEVDFVEYQELSELFSIVKVPVGRYQSISMELDYNDAYILIQDQDGQTYEAQAVDADDLPLTTYTVDFNLTDDRPLNVLHQKTNHLTLDLDLSASNTIKSFEPAVVQVEPFVLASVSLDDEREHRLRGTVASVDTEEQTLILNVKPMRKRGGEFGQWPIHFDENSQFEIDGEVMALAAALENLSTRGDTFPVVAHGVVTQGSDNDDTQFIASALLAGTSVPWFGKDVFKGMVTGIEQGLPYVTGLSLAAESATSESPTPAGSGRAHVQDALLTVSDETRYKSAWDKAMNANYLVPGQRVEALGQVSLEGESQSFDASGESIRILPSHLLGQVLSTDTEGQVTLDVARFNQRPGKLVRQGHQAFEIDSVTVDTSGLSQLSLNLGDWISVRGYFNPLSEEANAPQVWAKVVSQYELTESEIKYASHYGEEGTIPEIAEDNASMTLDLNEGHHKLHYRFNPVNMMPELSSLTIVSATETGHFSLRQRGEATQFFDTLSDLLAVLNEATQADSVNSVMAKGQLELESETLRVTDLVVKLN